MSVKVCREASEPAFTVADMGNPFIPTQGTEVIPYSCASKMDVEVCNKRNYFLVFFDIVPLSIFQAC